MSRLLLIVGFAATAQLHAARIAFIGDAAGAPARHGVAQLRAALEAQGHEIIAASAGDHAVLVGCQPGMTAVGPQSVVIRRTRHQGKPAVALCGGDARGLMYAALDVANRVAWAGKAAADPFRWVRDTSETPYLPERGVSMYTMHRAYFESRLFDENYWIRYFDLLAASRINTFTIIFGYENGGFMAPLYPYFFDVPGFPDVRLVGITREQQQRHTAALHTLIRIAHERGVDVIPAVWDHIYRGGVQGGGIEGASDTVGKEVPGLVAGVTTENLTRYTQAALRRFVEVFPEIDGIEFRMHAESGLKPEEMSGFWHEVFSMLAKAKPGLRVTLRAKELPDSIIDDGLQQGLRARVETKYWMEQIGLPFHPTHINRQDQSGRRHGYADLLNYPQRYRVHWRLWSGGSTRLLLWGDPEYVRRFAETARLYDGNSIDVNEMLATKMLGEPHDKQPFAIHTPTYRFYQYEFERYWHFYQVWGRVAYNPQTSAEVWEQEFIRRFGPQAGPALMKGLHAASRVVPRIVAASYRYQLFPTTRGWAEMMRQGDLPQFATTAEGSDIEQFQSPRDAAKELIAGSSTSMRRPGETSRWFQSVSDEILANVARAQGAAQQSAEVATTLVDLRILAWLARFHAARLNGAVDYNLYRETKSTAAFDRAIEQERTATEAWRQIVKAAGDVYNSDLAFGVHRVGFPRHWNEELQNLEAGLTKLVAERQSLSAAQASPAPQVPARNEPPKVRLLSVTAKARPGVDLVISAEAPGIRSLRLRYRHLTQVEDYATVDMKPDAGGKIYTARIPGSFIVPKWDLMYFVEAIDRNGNGRNYPDLDVETPYVIIPVAR